LVGKPEGKKHLGDLSINERMTLEWILLKYGAKVWTGYIWLRIRRIGTNGVLL
jgi:hypothetical protein